MSESLSVADPRMTSDESFSLTPSPDAAVVFASLAAQARARFCDIVVVELRDDDADIRLTNPPDVGVPIAPRLRADLRVELPMPDGLDALRGVVVFGWRDTRPTEAVTLLARALTGQAVNVLAWQRSEQRARNAATKAANLEIALVSSRQIGAAIGIVMSQRKVTSDDAFALLRQASQHLHRKVHDLALDVLDTGWLDPEFVRSPTIDARDTP